MILANGIPKFRTQHIEPLWSSKLDSIDALREHMPGTTLVAFDMEAAQKTQIISEFGLAMLDVDEKNLHYCIGRCRFFDENKVQALTIELSTKKCYEYRRLGETVKVKSEEDARVELEKKLQGLRAESKPLILVGYDLQTEFSWISRQFPVFASYFAGWVDVQELVATQHPDKSLGLTNALRAFSVKDNRHCAKRHSAANDGVRTLAILAAILAGKAPIIEQTPPTIKRFAKMRPTSAKEYPFTVRLRSEDGSTLPDCTWAEMCDVFASFDLKAVGRNTKKGRPVYTWWLAFNTVKGLRRFMRWIEYGTVRGKQLNVVLVTGLEAEAGVKDISDSSLLSMQR